MNILETYIHTYMKQQKTLNREHYLNSCYQMVFYLKQCYGSVSDPGSLYSTGLGNGIRCVKTVLKTFCSVVKILPMKRVIKSGNLILATKLIRFHVSFCLNNTKI